MKRFYFIIILLAINLSCCNKKISQETQAAIEPTLTGIDTIVFFNPETIEEFVIIINHDTGQRDTLKAIDLD